MTEDLNLTQTYEKLLKKTFKQIDDVQARLDEEIENPDGTVAPLASSIKALSSVAAEFARQRELAEVKEMTTVPVAALKEYHTEFFPKILTGLNELKKRIEGDLPPDQVAAFAKAWQANLRFYNNAVNDAIKYIDTGRLIKRGQELALEEIVRRRCTKVNDLKTKIKLSKEEEN